jgi:IclR family KDG regulon transcriptional repressor
MKANLINRHTLQDTDNKATVVQSVNRAAAILKCISDGHHSVTEIAAECSLHKSTAHRLLKALEEAGLVMQNPVSHQYFLGHLFVKLTLTPATSHEYLIDCAAEEMRRLSELTGETVDLRIMLGLKNIGLNIIQSKNDLIVVGDSLKIRPLKTGVDSLILLAQLNDEELRLTLKELTRESAAGRAKNDAEDMIKKIKLIRENGYVIKSNELIMGVTCICAPVKNYLVPAVLVLVGPEVRMKPREEELNKELVRCASRISKKVSEYLKISHR